MSGVVTGAGRRHRFYETILFLSGENLSRNINARFGDSEDPFIPACAPASGPNKPMGGGIFGSTTQPSWKGNAPQRCPTHVEDPYREYIVKESKWLDSFMERELNPPAPPRTYDVTPPNSRPGTGTPHFTSTALRPKPGDGSIIAVGCVPSGPTEHAPENFATKTERRAKLTALVAEQHRERLKNSGVNERGVADTGAGGVTNDLNRATVAWQANKTLREEDVFVTLAKKQREVDLARRKAARKTNTSTREVRVNNSRPLVKPASKPVTARSACTGNTRSSSKPTTAASLKTDIEIVTRLTGSPGEQSKSLVLNLDHLEDSSFEVLLHEVRKAEIALLAGEEPPETYEKTMEALAVKEGL